ncbi:hypothetical protein Tco_0405144 [Tanacetum coccineum]
MTNSLSLLPQEFSELPSPVPLPDDPYVAVRQAQLVDTDTESDPEDAPLEVEELQSLDSTAPLSPDHPLTHVSPTPTPTCASFHHRTARMAVYAQPAMSPGLLASMTKAMALLDSAFHKRYKSSYETPSPSLTLLVRKRYRGTSELVLDTNIEGDELGDEDAEDEILDADDEREGLDDEDHGLNDEDHGLDDEDYGLDDEGRSLDDEGRGLNDEGRSLDDKGLGLEGSEEEAVPEG